MINNVVYMVYMSTFVTHETILLECCILKLLRKNAILVDFVD